MTEVQDVTTEDHNRGRIVSIDGPVIKVRGLKKAHVGDLVKIGHKRLTGEIVKHFGSVVVCQCYDFTTGLQLNEPVENTNKPISMQLGPGLLNHIFDGIQRPLDKLIKFGPFLKKGLEVDTLSKKVKWKFTPTVKEGQSVYPGDIIGEVEETKSINHKIMVPLDAKAGSISWIVEEGNYTAIDDIYTIRTDDNTKTYDMIQYQPIRQQRRYSKFIVSKDPLITGLRVLDVLLPIAKGGTVAVPGGFGTGKTVIQHSLAKWADADIVIYVGCGERGNEMTDVLEEFPHLENPHTGRPIMEKTIIIGNTSNMPVSAREASIFSGLTMAEYYRDMGYHVALLADSTTRWAEALREISSRLEEIPAEGGYPAYLSTKLAQFFERGGFVQSLGTPQRNGSITLIASVSPPSGNFSEPVTKTIRRFTKAFWALDPKLAYARFYPAINTEESYSLYGDNLGVWWNDIRRGWNRSRLTLSNILSSSQRVKKLLKIIGEENLPLDQQLTIKFADLIRNSFLIQNAFHSVDCYCAPEKTMAMIYLLNEFYNECQSLLKYDVPIFRMFEIPSVLKINKIRLNISNKDFEMIDELLFSIKKDIAEIRAEYREINLQNVGDREE